MYHLPFKIFESTYGPNSQHSENFDFILMSLSSQVSHQSSHPFTNLNINFFLFQILSLKPKINRKHQKNQSLFTVKRFK